MNESADNSKNSVKYGRRKTDGGNNEKDIPQPQSSLWRSIFNGIGLAFVITALIAVGRFSGQMDSTVSHITKQNENIEKILISVATLTEATKNNSESIRDNKDFLKGFLGQQRESDKEFLDVIKDIKNGVDRNRESIIIMQQKVSHIDKTKVELYAMR
jgi:methyl-accepting chemotaxis protein